MEDKGTHYDLEFLLKSVRKEPKKDKAKYRIFSPQQIEYLSDQFLKKPRWTRKDMRRMSEHLGGISVTKIYKWNWDRHKRVYKGLPLTRDEEIQMRYAN